MDGRQYAERKRAMSLYGFSRRNPNKPNYGGAAASVIVEKADGPYAIINHGVLVNNEPAIMDEQIAQEEARAAAVAAPCTTQTLLFVAIDQLIQYHASVSIAPTRCARNQYLFFVGLAGAYNWVTPQQSITGTKDSWNWATKVPLALEEEQATFLANAIGTVLTTLITNYTYTPLTQYLTDQQRASQGSVLAKGNFSAWQTAWQTWWTARQADGSVAAGAFPTPAELPNGSTFLDVSATQDFSDPAAYPNPRNWTPLIVQGGQKKYLTMNWNNVISPSLTGAQETTVKSTAATEVLTGTARNTELASLWSIVQTLTEEQKMIAEFWAGGPTTTSPPGIAIWMWRHAVWLSGQQSSTIAYSGLELSIHLFEASRLTWGLKAQFKEARPIQEFRRIYNGQNATNYDGTTIAAALWVPFQMPNFVTPPFPDFPSGHSTFSQAFANVMTDWFGPTVPSQTFSPINARAISPIYSTSPEWRLDQIPVPAQSSEIQPTVPASPLTLSFSTWQDMAEQAGISRQYGGIHAESAHLGGQAVANGIAPLITASWSIQKV